MKYIRKLPVLYLNDNIQIDSQIFYDIGVAREFVYSFEEGGGHGLRAEDLFALGVVHSLSSVLVNSIDDEVVVQGSVPVRCSVARYVQDFQVDVDAVAGLLCSEFVFEAEAVQAEVSAGAERVEAVLRSAAVLRVHNENPAFTPVKQWISDEGLITQSAYASYLQHAEHYLDTQHPRAIQLTSTTSRTPAPPSSTPAPPSSHQQPSSTPAPSSILALLREPARRHPNSLTEQLEFMAGEWAAAPLLQARAPELFQNLLRALDYLREADAYNERAGTPTQTLPPEFSLESYISADSASASELDSSASANARPSTATTSARFSKDSDWMPRVVLLAKSTLVWLDQLSKQYEREITRLNQIPEAELDKLAERGFNALWLIGLWERSSASKTIKEWCGNPDAAASAYSLYSNNIADEIGGWEALNSLRERCSERGIRLAADMVPNHTGIDSEWVHNKPDYFLSLPYSPYPNYQFNSYSLSSDPRYSIQIEDNYYNRSDAAVVFKRIDHETGDTRYIYHGNDGTSTPWNDTAQLNYLNPEVREAIIQEILKIARVFPIIRFDAAMTLAKEHIQRLWFPPPGSGGAIASRSEHGLNNADFQAAMPQEFWRELVDRVAQEVPDTLLLAEAFWMMEGYFVRTLGMHRVYNSAFMHMLKNEDNAKYREIIKGTLASNPQILRRFVNFMNNPDEDTAIEQFGDGDKYFGVCSLLLTTPGLPMIGHGQVEGFREKYGMEFRRSYWNEAERADLLERHEAQIFPLMRERWRFSGVENFRMYDLLSTGLADVNGAQPAGTVNEHVYAISNLADHTSLSSPATRTAETIAQTEETGVQPEAEGSENTAVSLVLYNNCYERASGRIRYSSEVQGAGSRSIADALQIPSNCERIELYDLVRRRWDAYTSTEIRNEGLPVVLNGFETRVYLSVRYRS